MDPSGILNIDKPPGWTSFRVVSLVRRGARLRKTGHAGTLDPPATGVLLVCTGQAVRVVEYLMDLPKLYRAEVRLGIATDTYDATGRPTFQGDPSSVTEETLRKALASFRGVVQQVPPSFSALKVGGTPAYRLAHRGEAVELKPRPATIYRIELLRFRPPVAEVEVECGRGTYVRSLAHDLGQRLGCGAHLQRLVRLRVGPFRLEDALALDDLRPALADGSWREHLLPLDYGLGHLPAVTLELEDEKDVRHGCPLPADLPIFAPLAGAADGQHCRAYGEDGSFVGILVLDAAAAVWRPEKVFAPS